MRCLRLMGFQVPALLADSSAAIFSVADGLTTAAPVATRFYERSEYAWAPSSGDRTFSNRCSASISMLLTWIKGLPELWKVIDRLNQRITQQRAGTFHFRSEVNSAENR